jgi:DNA-binding MarR family transcriptional regulator
VSRADLARYTGLQASTVSVIVGQLIDEGWVLTGELGRLPRGRRPTYVMLNDKHATLAIDLRPSEANLAVVDINGKILGRETVVFSAESSPRTMPEAQSFVSRSNLQRRRCERLRQSRPEDASTHLFSECAMGPD